MSNPTEEPAKDFSSELRSELQPAYVKDNPVMVSAYASFIDWIWRQEEARKRFERETRTPPLRAAKSPIDAAIDQALGVEDSYMKAFIRWATVTQWGVAGDPRLDDDDPQ